jgi:four helix bundle protein
MGEVSNFEFGEQFKKRTKQFALRMIKLFQALPSSDEARLIGKQLLRSSTSVAANYRAACRARSQAEFIAKIGVVIEEADEALFWLELLEEAAIIPTYQLAALKKEAGELVAITVSIRTTTKGKTPVPKL